MRKRQRFVVSTLLLLVALGVFRAVPFEVKYLWAVVAGGMSVVLFAWSLKEGLVGVEWLTLLLLPPLYVVSFLLFSMLVPDMWPERLVAFLLPEVVYDLVPGAVVAGVGKFLIYVSFVIGVYSLLLTENIYSVAAIRTIGLLRAAHAVGFLLTIVTGFLAFYTLATFRMSFWLLGPGVAGVSLGLILPVLWSVNLEGRVTRRVVYYTGGLGVGLGFLATAGAFWPVNMAVYALFLCTGLYVFLGIVQSYLAQKLLARAVWEYIIAGSVVLGTMLITSGLG